METLLKRFYMDESTRETVLAFLLDCVTQKGIEKLLKREDTSGIADAHDIINEAFITLQETYGEKPKPVVTTSR